MNGCIRLVLALHNHQPIGNFDGVHVGHRQLIQRLLAAAHSVAAAADSVVVADSVVAAADSVVVAADSVVVAADSVAVAGVDSLRSKTSCRLAVLPKLSRRNRSSLPRRHVQQHLP